MPGIVWDEITYPFPKFNGITVEVWEWISNFIYNGFNYLTMLALPNRLLIYCILNILYTKVLN